MLCNVLCSISHWKRASQIGYRLREGKLIGLILKSFSIFNGLFNQQRVIVDVIGQHPDIMKPLAELNNLERELDEKRAACDIAPMLEKKYVSN